MGGVGRGSGVLGLVGRTVCGVPAVLATKAVEVLGIVVLVPDVPRTRTFPGGPVIFRTPGPGLGRRRGGGFFGNRETGDKPTKTSSFGEPNETLLRQGFTRIRVSGTRREGRPDTRVEDRTSTTHGVRYRGDSTHSRSGCWSSHCRPGTRHRRCSTGRSSPESSDATHIRGRSPVDSLDDGAGRREPSSVESKEEIDSVQRGNSLMGSPPDTHRESDT